MPDGYGALTEREKKTLRLIVRGHDAKSIARHLGLSVHTINERLRDARRKLSVSSSREAARLLLDIEGDAPDFVADNELGEAARPMAVAPDAGPTPGPRQAHRFARIALGAFLMSFALILVAVATLSPQQPTAPAPATTPVVAAEAIDAEVEASARRWLALVDQGQWEASWAATGASFRALNTSAVWASASARARVPLGAMLSRTLLSQESVPAPPSGYEMVKFRTDFANRAGAVETVSLSREGGGWRVVGIWIS